MARHWVLGLLLAGVIMFLPFISTNAYANGEHTGFDLSISISEPVLYQSAQLDARQNNYKSHERGKIDTPFIGLSNFKISIGYRWKYVGVYFEQELGGILWLDKNNISDGLKVAWSISNTGTNAWFLGGSFICARGIIPVNNIFDVAFTGGFGMMYSDEGYEYVDPLLYNSDNDPVPWMAVKLGIAITYYFRDWAGFGLNFDYNLAFKIFDLTSHGNGRITSDYEYAFSDSSDISLTVMMHHIVPGIHFQFHF